MTIAVQTAAGNEDGMNLLSKKDQLRYRRIKPAALRLMMT
jgi:hypothetical protein